MRNTRLCEFLERETGFEPATSTLARLHSTAELLPLGKENLLRCIVSHVNTFPLETRKFFGLFWSPPLVASSGRLFWSPPLAASSVRKNSLGRQPSAQGTVQSCKPDCFGIVKRETHFIVKGHCSDPCKFQRDPMDTQLLAILACPACRGALSHSTDPEALHCPACAVVYPASEGIPLLLKEEAVPAAEWRKRHNPDKAEEGQPL